ncbi:hypothetical protein SAMN05216387_1022 [Nitrosovibrio tenuis]|uniref:Uncharacterized protein n=1 Tax=Nitrosovibrio tenuis TaxID=1233 RepID=A0A1H7HYQ3_9PROT|nr:hypothetical protein SAMN05216387_1022 [Nitrosovibrio tenuis]
MFRINYALLFCLIFLPIIGYGADDPQKTYLIAKDKLKCLYQQTDNLLKEGDPVIVFLSNE